MQTNVALGGDTFRLTRNNFFYFGWRKVLVSDQETLERIRDAIQWDRVFELANVFKELGGNER